MTTTRNAGGANLDVLIVGAGPTGLTLACELARRNVSFRIIEVSSGPQAGSRGKGLQPRSLEVFDDLGIVDQILANGRMAMHIVSMGPDGISVAGGEPLRPPRHDIPYATSVMTPQWRVEEALRARLASFGASVEFTPAQSALPFFGTGDEARRRGLPFDPGCSEEWRRGWIEADISLGLNEADL